MRVFKILGVLTIFLFLSCSKVEQFSKEKPYAIQIAKERSFYQAEKLTNRLLDMDLKAYMIQHLDSLNNDGNWYYILCDNIEVLDSAKSKRTRLEKQFKLKDLKIVSFENFQNASFELDDLKKKEKQKIASNKPNIDKDIFDVINKFPENNSLLVQKTFVFNTPKDTINTKGFSFLNTLKTDLPRGISKKLILKNTTAFSEVIYKDNLYGDRVTIDIGKLRDKTSQISEASLLSFRDTESSYKIAEEYTDLILETGDYLFEEKKKIKIESYKMLYGYKVTIEPKKYYFRTYLVLVDEESKFVVFSQSTDKSDEELIKLLSDIGQGKGLINYAEFYNAFYTMPENGIDGDRFIGFTINKLDWSYVKSRRYTKWSKKMVGYWNATGYFHNNKKGTWYYSIFDLLTPESQNYIYGNLYTKKRRRKRRRIGVYGTNGFVLYSHKKISEINFGIDRYVAAMGNTDKSWFSKSELLQRAEALQFEKIDK